MRELFICFGFIVLLFSFFDWNSDHNVSSYIHEPNCEIDYWGNDGGSSFPVYKCRGVGGHNHARNYKVINLEKKWIIKSSAIACVIFAFVGFTGGTLLSQIVIYSYTIWYFFAFDGHNFWFWVLTIIMGIMGYISAGLSVNEDSDFTTTEAGTGVMAGLYVLILIIYLIYKIINGIVDTFNAYVGLYEFLESIFS